MSKLYEGLLPVLEKDVEAAFVRGLKKRGLKSVKLNVQGQRGWHDRLVLIPGGRPVFMELKRPGAGLTGSQPEIHAFLEGLGGYHQHVCDDATKALEIVDEILSARLPRAGHSDPA